MFYLKTMYYKDHQTERESSSTGGSAAIYSKLGRPNVSKHLDIFFFFFWQKCGRVGIDRQERRRRGERPLLATVMSSSSGGGEG